MARSTRSRTRSRGTADPAQAARESAQKIWLAGLGAFERAKTEGPRVFEALVEQGRDMGARAVGAADQALRSMREASASGGGLEKLEKIIEERVSRSLNRLGLVTRDQADDLARQVRELSDSLQAFAAASRRAATGGGKRRASRKSTAARPAAKRAKAAKGGARKPRAKAKRRAG